MVVAPSAHHDNCCSCCHFTSVSYGPLVCNYKQCFYSTYFIAPKDHIRFDEGKPDSPFSVYVVFPKIAQDGVNSSTLDIQSLIITNPTNQSFHLHQTNIVKSTSKYHPQLDQFNASLSLEGSDPYADISIPPVHATGTATSTIDQDVQITNLDRFTEYSIALLNSEQVNLTVHGRTGLHEMRFPTTTVNYDKVVAMNG